MARMLGKAGQKSGSLRGRRCHCIDCHDVCWPDKQTQRTREKREAALEATAGIFDRRYVESFFPTPRCTWGFACECGCADYLDNFDPGPNNYDEPEDHP